MIFGLIGLFRRFFACENRRLRYLSDSSYWLYLAHLPLLVGLQIWVSDWNLPHSQKFLLVCALTFAILIVVYEHLVRYTIIGTVLNGKKTRPEPASSALAVNQDCPAAKRRLWRGHLEQWRRVRWNKYRRQSRKG
jgi:peptidoglycan/LPS O-acetylase OafA/YrhL